MAGVQLAPRNPDDLASRINTPGYTPYTREEYAQAHAPSDQDIATVRQYLESHDLTVSAVSPDRRSLTVTGTVADAERTFSTQLTCYKTDGQEFHARTGSLTVPAEVEPLIEGVFGLDTRPFARRRSATTPRHTKGGHARAGGGG